MLVPTYLSTLTSMVHVDPNVLLLFCGPKKQLLLAPLTLNFFFVKLKRNKQCLPKNMLQQCLSTLTRPPVYRSR